MNKFSEIYSFESYIYDFWILEAGKLFFEKYYSFLIFISPAPDVLGIKFFFPEKIITRAIIYFFLN